MSTDQMLALFAAKEATRFKMKVGVFAIVMNEDKVLLLRRFQTGIADGRYVLPMGGHDGKEPLTHTMIREAKEEINIEVRPEDLSVCHVMHRFHPMPNGFSFEQMDVYFKIEGYAGEIHNNEPDRCDELSFYPLDALPEKLEPFIAQALQCARHGQFYSEFGFGGYQ